MSDVTNTEQVSALNAIIALIGHPDALARAHALLAHAGLSQLSQYDAATLHGLGLTLPQARRVEAAFNLGRAAERAQRAKRARLDRPAAVARLLAPEVRGLEAEHFYVLCLDARHELVHVQCVSVGTLIGTQVHPREVFQPALRRACAAIVVAHNHPSGDPEPSAEDIAVTRRLHDAGVLLGVPCLDHVVLGEGRWVSIRERFGMGSPQ